MSKVIADYRCKICEKNYSSYQSLWIHNKKCHPLNSTISSTEFHNFTTEFHNFTTSNYSM